MKQASKFVKGYLRASFSRDIKEQPNDGEVGLPPVLRGAVLVDIGKRGKETGVEWRVGHAVQLVSDELVDHLADVLLALQEVP